jgi:hypothetical protein
MATDILASIASFTIAVIVTSRIVGITRTIRIGTDGAAEHRNVALDTITTHL